MNLLLFLLSFFILKGERIKNVEIGKGAGREILNHVYPEILFDGNFYTITVRIFHFFSNEGDEWDGQDTYYKITIDDGHINSTFQTPVVAENNNEYDGKITYSRVVYDTIVSVKIEVWDSDFWSSDDQLKIGGDGSDNSCDLIYNINEKKWWGDTDSLWVKGNGSQYSAIWFYIQSDPDNETPGRYRYDDTLFHSCGLLSGLALQKSGSINALANFWDEYYTFLTQDTLYNSFLNFGNYFLIKSQTIDSAWFDIYLYHPAENLLDSSTNPDTTSELIEIFNPDTGKYFLEFIKRGPSGGIRNFYYRISDKIFIEKDTTFKGFLVYNFQNINYYDWKDEYLFYKKNNESINIVLLPENSLDADLFIFDSTGNLILSSENIGYGVPENLYLSSGEGYYYFLIYQKEGEGIYQVIFEKNVYIEESSDFAEMFYKGDMLILDITGRKRDSQKEGILFIKKGKFRSKMILIDLKNKAFIGYNFKSWKSFLIR